MFRQQKHCTPAALEMFYTEQQQQQRSGLRAVASGGLYAALSHLNQVKKSEPELPRPWLPVVNAMKEEVAAAEAATNRGGEPQNGALQGEE